MLELQTVNYQPPTVSLFFVGINELTGEVQASPQAATGLTLLIFCAFI